MRGAQKLPESTKQNREMVDALREVLGMGPLYRADRHSTVNWLATITEKRWQLQAGPASKGRPT